MLVGLDRDAAQVDILRALSDSPYEFHLTGSRFFGVSSYDSDYDFFTVSAPGVTDFLGSLEGNCLVGDYLDNMTIEVYRYTQARVDVQVIRPGWFAIKKDAQEIFKQLYILRPTYKQWEALSNLLNTNRFGALTPKRNTT